MTLTNRTLAIIADDLRVVLRRETDNIFTIGNLLVEAKAHVRHGEWLPWLKQEFYMSERSAQKYMKAAEFAVKSELDADLKLSPSALYLLSEDGHWGKGHGRREATDAVIRAAKEERVDDDRAKEIIEKTIADVAAAEGAESRTEDTSAPEHTKPRSDVNPRDELVWSFSTIAAQLVPLTKNRDARRFAKTVLSVDDLARLGTLLTEIADLKKSEDALRSTAETSAPAVASELTAGDARPKCDDQDTLDVAA